VGLEMQAEEKQKTLIIQKFMKEVIRPPVKFSTGAKILTPSSRKTHSVSTEVEIPKG
jgi:hypothetical protein